MVALGVHCLMGGCNGQMCFQLLPLFSFPHVSHSSPEEIMFPAGNATQWQSACVVCTRSRICSQCRRALTHSCYLVLLCSILTLSTSDQILPLPLFSSPPTDLKETFFSVVDFPCTVPFSDIFPLRS